MKKNLRVWMCLCISGLLLTYARSAHSATQTFTGAVSGDIELAANYASGSSVPADDTTTDELLVSATATNQPTLTKSRSLNKLTFAKTTGGSSLGGAFTLTLGSAGIDSNNTSGSNTITSGLTLATSQTFTTSTGGTLTLNSTINNGGNLLTMGGTGTVIGNASAVISGAGGLTINGASVTTNAAQTYTGATTINSGFLQLSGASQGAGAISGTGGTLYLNNTALNLSNNISGGVAVSLFANATLSGSNSYTGATSVNAKVLTIGSNGGLSGTSPVTVASGGQLAIPRSGTYGGTASITLTGTGGGSGALYSNVNSVTTTIASPIVLNGSATIQEYGVSHILNFTNTISGTGDLTLIGGAASTSHTGSIGLAGAASYSGNTIISNGAQQLTVNLTGGNNRLSTGTLTFTTLGAGYTDTLDLNGNTQTITTLSASSANTGSLVTVKSTGSLGTLTPNSSANPSVNVNNFTQTNVNISTPGYVQINSGTYTLNSGTLGTGSELLNSFSASSTFTQNGGTVDAFQSRVATVGTGTYNLNGGIFLTDKLSGTGGTSILNFNGGTLGVSTRSASFAATDFFNSVGTVNILNGGAKFDTTNGSVGMSQILKQGASSTGGLTKLGANTLTLKGASTYTGPTTISAGTLAAGVASVANTSGALGNNSGVTLANTAGATLNITGFNTQIGSLTGGGTAGGNVVLGAATLTTGADNTSPAPYAGVISGTSGAISKVGSGTQILTGTNTYTGTTTVSGGTLLVNNTTGSGTGTGAVTVASGGTLGGSGTSSGAVTVASGGINAPGASGPGIEGVGNYSNSGTLAADVTGTTVGTGYDQVNVTGTVTLGGALKVTVPTSYVPTVGSVYTLINNDSNDAVSGTFSGVAEGGLVNSVNGRVTFVVSYVGGDGNDVTLTVSSTSTSSVLISEFRASGPGASGTGDATDEFIELANTTGASQDVSGWTVTAGGVFVTIPAGKSIPAFGHLLLTNAGTGNGDGYSLAGYATGDVSYTGDIDLTSTLVLKDAGGTTIDSVGNLSAIAAPSSANNQYSYVRRLESGVPQDTDTDSSDFNLVDTVGTAQVDGTGVGPMTGARLGAPGPQNTLSPVQRNSGIIYSETNIAGVPSSGKYASKGTPIDPQGRLTLRRNIKNVTGGTVSKLRFRLVAITGGNTPAGVADLRAITSAGVTLNGTKVVQGITMEAPSSPTNLPTDFSAATVGTAKGGGLNTSWQLLTIPNGPLQNGDNINVEFLFGVVTNGNYRVAIDVELLP